MLPLVNIHTHHKPQPRERALRYGWLPATDVALGALPYHVSVGLHPWWAGRYSGEELGARLNTAVMAQNVRAVGEIGLDRVNGPDLAIQKQVFEQQWETAVRHNLAIVAHCVRAYADMQAYLKRSYVPFIFHDYHGNTETTEQLLRFDTAYFSLGKILFRNPKAAHALLQQIPRERLFLETDTMPLSINTVYDAAAALLKMDKEELAVQIWETSQRIWKRDF